MASKIKVDQIQTGDGTGTIALQNQLSGMTHASVPTLTTGHMPSGSVLQVKYAQSSANVTVSTGGTYADVITLNFTPLSATSQMMVGFSGVYYKQGTTTSNAKFKILRDSTPADQESWTQASNTAHYLNYGDTNHHNLIIPLSYTVFDQPLSTSTITYKFQVGNSGPDLAFYAGVKLIVTEIAG